jgi:sugar phosphate isomerase/epimerase
MEAKTVKALLDKYNIKATLHFYDKADLGSYPEVVDAYLVLLERYCKLGEGYIESRNNHLCPGPVVTISGVKNYIYEKEYDDYIKRFVSNLHRAEKICNDHGIRMVIENTNNIPSMCKRTYKDLYDAGFKFCYDLGHDHLIYDLVQEVIKDIPSELQEFHFHDGKDRKKCHLALGEGTIDLKKFKELTIKHYAWVNLDVKQASDLRVSVPYFRNL